MKNPWTRDVIPNEKAPSPKFQYPERIFKKSYTGIIFPTQQMIEKK